MTKAERTKQFIIETASPIFNKKGVAGTTIDDVLKATKMAKGGLYGHFTNKDELSQEVVSHLLYKLRTAMKQLVDNQNSAKEKLFAFLDNFSNPQQTMVEGGCPMLNFGSEADDTDTQIKKQVKATILSTLKLLEGIVNKGIEDQEFKETFIAGHFAIKTFTMIEGNILVARVLSTDKYSKLSIEILKKEIEENCI